MERIDRETADHPIVEVFGLDRTGYETLTRNLGAHYIDCAGHPVQKLEWDGERPIYRFEKGVNPVAARADMSAMRARLQSEARAKRVQLNPDGSHSDLR